MAMYKCSEKDQAYLRSGRYAVISTMKVEPAAHRMSLDSFVQLIRDQSVVLESVTLHPRDAVCVVDAKSLEIAIVVLASSQGTIFGGEDATSDTDKDGEAAAESNDHPRGQSAAIKWVTTGLDPIEESARAGAEETARESRKRSMQSIDIGQRMAERAENEGLSLEEASAELSGSTNEKISRATYSAAQGKKQKVDFVGNNREIGGNRQIPTCAMSEQTFTLRRCYVKASPDNGRLSLQGSADDPGWVELTRIYPNTFGFQYANNDPEMRPLRLAEAMTFPVDLVVCVAERVKTGKRSFVSLQVLNFLALIGAVRVSLDQIEAQYAD